MPSSLAYGLLKTVEQPETMKHGTVLPIQYSAARYTESKKPAMARTRKRTMSHLAGCG